VSWLPVLSLQRSSAPRREAPGAGVATCDVPSAVTRLLFFLAEPGKNKACRLRRSDAGGQGTQPVFVRSFEEGAAPPTCRVHVIQGSLNVIQS
jgi:hypothetical protein